jgi:hypothetical protein
LLLEWRGVVGQVDEVDHEADGCGIVTVEVEATSTVWHAFENNFPFICFLDESGQGRGQCRAV